MTLVAFLIGLPMLKSEVAFNAVASISVSPMLLHTSQNFTAFRTCPYL